MYDGDNISLVLDDTGAVTARVLYGPATGQVLAEEDVSPSSDVVTWSLGDNQNTVRDLAQYNATTGVTMIVDHRGYTAFGQPLTTPAVDFLFGYTGSHYDAATGLQWNLNRWYNPSLQRWMGQDPLGLGPDANPYRYCGNGPTNATDPTGMAEQCVATPAAVLVGQVTRLPPVRPDEAPPQPPTPPPGGYPNTGLPAIAPYPPAAVAVPGAGTVTVWGPRPSQWHGQSNFPIEEMEWPLPDGSGSGQKPGPAVKPKVSLPVTGKDLRDFWKSGRVPWSVLQPERWRPQLKVTFGNPDLQPPEFYPNLNQGTPGRPSSYPP
ncbi:MAG: RHS repeat-associated core domain-containing protein [Thermoguttaceae bacterium]